MVIKNFRLLFLMLILIVSSISVTATLDNLGSTQIREPITLVQACTNATYITISTIQLPNKTLLNINTNMTPVSGGTFSYLFNATDILGRYDVTGFSDACELDFAYYFDVTLSGYVASVSAYILILVFLVFLFIFLIWVNVKFNKKRREQMYQKVVSGYFKSKHGYEKSNLGNMILTSLGYGLLEIMFTYYYLIIVAFLFILTEFVDTFGIKSLTILLNTILGIFLWGFIPLFIIMLFVFYNVIMNAIGDINKMFQGVMKTW